MSQNTVISVLKGLQECFSLQYEELQRMLVKPPRDLGKSLRKHMASTIRLLRALSRANKRISSPRWGSVWPPVMTNGVPPDR